MELDWFKTVVEHLGFKTAILLIGAFILSKAVSKLVLDLLRMLREKILADQSEVQENRKLLDRLITTHVNHLQESQTAFMKYQVESTTIQTGILQELQKLHEDAQHGEAYRMEERTTHAQLQADLSTLKGRLGSYND